MPEIMLLKGPLLLPLLPREHGAADEHIWERNAGRGDHLPSGHVDVSADMPHRQPDVHPAQKNDAAQQRWAAPHLDLLAIAPHVGEPDRDIRDRDAEEKPVEAE